ncbi:MAG: DNA methyltransferase [Shewanella sp.]
MMLRNFSLKEDLPPATVNIEDKKRSNLFTWRGQFSPQLIEAIICSYAKPNDVIFDPFIGSGTVLFEAAQFNLSALGCEINPAAVAFAKVYELINLPKKAVDKELNKVELFISKKTNTSTFDANSFESDLLEFFFNEKNEISRTILLALITGLDFEIKKINLKRIINVWGSLRGNIENLPKSDNNICCYHRDARETKLRDNSIDFVLTSPPYINVFNYHQNYRKSIEKTGADVLSVAKSEIGANRKFRQNRFLTVVQYCMDMSQVFMEINRICKRDAKVIFIVGRESNVRRTPFKNAKLITSVAEACGFCLVGEQERCFTNMFGESIYEEILRFEIVESANNKHKEHIELSRKIGQNALFNALKNCDESVRIEIEDAISKSNKIDVSPILNSEV